jgi:hypothetical protein
MTMRILPNPTIFRDVMFYLRMGIWFVVTWVICRIAVYVITIGLVIAAVYYGAYLPDNPKYRRNYEDTKVAPSNPFTSNPRTYTNDMENTNGR